MKGPPNPQEPTSLPIELNDLQTIDSSEVASSKIALRDLTRYSYKINYRDSLKYIQEELIDSLALILSTQSYRKAIVKDKPLKSLESLYLTIHKISIATF